MTKRFTLRIDDTLDDWLTEQAALYNRSKNKHIAYLLQSIKNTSEENQRRLSDISVEADLFESASTAIVGGVTDD